MPQLRRDPIVNRWVISATERAIKFVPREAPKGAGSCPFCEGKEHTTPPEILSFRHDGSAPDRPG